MKAKPITIIPLHSSSLNGICEMSDSLRQQIGLRSDITSIKITCGMHTVSCSLVFIKEKQLSLKLSIPLLSKLHLPLHEFSIQLKPQKHDEILIGPIIALLTDIKRTEHLVQFGGIHDFCEELATYCEAKGVFFYVFSLSGYSKDAITGFYFHQNKWHEAVLPFPHAVHNRIHSRKRERSKLFLDVTSDLIAKKIPYFNDRFLNKWEVHQILLATDHLLPYLPDSQLLESKSDLEQLLTEKKDLFIKPINGSLGKRIFRVRETEDDSYQLDFTTFSNEMKHQYNSFQQLYSSLYPRLKKEGFLLQETIPLKKYKKRTLDFRFLCHKKDYQTWKVSSSVARVSGNNQFVSNIARGGEIHSVKDVLDEFYTNRERVNLQKLLTELSIEIVHTICSHAGGEFGEFGIDLAIDENGHPWIIEVNTKPSKSQDDKGIGKVRPSARAIINYCLFLSQMNE